MKNITKLLSYALISITTIWVLFIVLFYFRGRNIFDEQMYYEGLRWGIEIAFFMILFTIPIYKNINCARLMMISISSVSFILLLDNMVLTFINGEYLIFLTTVIQGIFLWTIAFVYSRPSVSVVYRKSPAIKIIEYKLSISLIQFVTVFLVVFTFIVLFSRLLNLLFTPKVGLSMDWNEAVYILALLFSFLGILRRKKDSIWILISIFIMLSVHGLFNAIFIPKYCQGIYVIIYGFFSAIAFFYLCSSNSEYWEIDSKSNEAK